MPVEPNQQPFPGQKQLLSTSRLQSSIPKGGTESSWVYPSPQMFYNGKLTQMLFLFGALVHQIKLEALCMLVDA